jgi:inosine/xanthosine triphosphate pyrophosphatase family protein
MEAFAEIPGVSTERIYDDDTDNNREILARQAREEMRAQTVAAILGDG